MASFNEISVQKLSKLIGTPECPILIDVRIDEDFDDDPRFVPTAYRHPFHDIASLRDELCNYSVIIYCQKGLKISQGAAAILRNMKIDAQVLEGGQFAWRDAGMPMVSSEKVFGKNFNKPTVWVTRHRPKIDRIACPWLIRRFIDPNAQFLFVSSSQVKNVAEKFNAIPFDTEDGFLSHRDELCTFDIMLEEFGIKNEALEILATIIRGADTNKHDIAPEVAGLLVMSLGLSRMYRDDLVQLDESMIVYDALYRWARDAQGEAHASLTSFGKT